MKQYFSEMEYEVIKILKRRKTTQMTLITDRIYKDRDKPICPSSVVSSAIRRINVKCEKHNLGWNIEGKGLGRNGRVVWINKGA